MKNLIGISVIVLLMAAGLGGCKGGSGMADGLLTVDVTASYPVKELVLQDFMDVEYVALETTDEFLTQGHVMAVDDNIIIVKNYVNDGDIFIFDRATGKGLRKINRRGQGGEEYNNSTRIALDADRGEMFVSDVSSRKVFVYDLYGNFKRSFDFKEGVMYTSVFEFDQGDLICHDGSLNIGGGEEKRELFFVVSGRDGSVIKEIQVPFEEKLTMMVYVRDESSGAVIANTPSSDFPLIRLEKDWLLVEPSADTFYRYNSEHVMTPFIARTPPVRSMTPEVFLLPSVITDRYYFMDAVKKEWNFETHDGFPRTLLVYDRVEGAIYESVVYNGDYSGKEKTPLYSKPMSEDIAFSGLLEAGELVEDYNEGRLKGRLAEIAAELDEESNPVVMFVKHRRAS